MFPYQLIVKQEKAKSVTFTLYKTVSDMFASSSACFLLEKLNYGSFGQVIINFKNF